MFKYALEPLDDGLTAEYPATLKLYPNWVDTRIRSGKQGYADKLIRGHHRNWIPVPTSCNILQNTLSYMQHSKFPRKASYKYYIHRSLKHGTETSKDCDQSIRQISTKAK